MKNGNWMPIDTRLAVFLPKDREYTELEAMYSLQLNYDRGATVTVAGLAASWQWKRHAVYALLKKVGASVVYQGKRKSRSTGGIIAPIKGACQAHVGDMSCACRAHVRLIKNNKLDDKRCISVASQPHDDNMWASLLSIPQITYSYKDKEGGKNDRPGNNNHAPLSHLNGDGYGQHMQDQSKEDGKGHNPFPVVNGSDGDSGNQPTCEANLNGGLLDGQDTANTRTGLDVPGQSLNDDIHPGDNRGSVGDSSSLDGVDGQTPVGEDGAPMDREEVGHDILGAKEEDEAKPPKKAKEKNGIPYQAIVEILNEHTGKSFRHTAKQTQALIRARWRDGYTVDDFRRVIIGRVEKWSGDPKMCEYLRPPTLFGGKFESYLQADLTIKKVNLPKNQNKIKCKECANFGTCQNAEEDPIASCALYTPQREMVVHQHGSGNGQAKARTVSQMIILENDAIAKALLDDRERKEAMANE